LVWKIYGRSNKRNTMIIIISYKMTCSKPHFVRRFLIKPCELKHLNVTGGKESKIAIGLVVVSENL